MISDGYQLFNTWHDKCSYGSYQLLVIGDLFCGGWILFEWSKILEMAMLVIDHFQ